MISSEEMHHSYVGNFFLCVLNFGQPYRSDVRQRHFLPLAWPQETIAVAPIGALRSHLATLLC